MWLLNHKALANKPVVMMLFVVETTTLGVHVSISCVESCNIVTQIHMVSISIIMKETAARLTSLRAHEDGDIFVPTRNVSLLFYQTSQYRDSSTRGLNLHLNERDCCLIYITESMQDGDIFVPSRSVTLFVVLNITIS